MTIHAVVVRSCVVLVVAVLIGACSEPASPPPESPPPSLNGLYTAMIPAKDFAAEGVPKSFGGKWTLDVSGGQYVLEGAFRITENIEVNSDEELTVGDVPAPAGMFNCYEKSGTRLMPPDVVEGTYTFTLSDDALDISVDNEPCPYREMLLDREWTRE
jgi:hypothetical protein